MGKLERNNKSWEMPTDEVTLKTERNDYSRRSVERAQGLGLEVDTVPIPSAKLSTLKLDRENSSQASEADKANSTIGL